MEYAVTLTPENVEKAEKVIEEIVRQGQNGVTVFHPRGILMNILLGLGFSPVNEDGGDL